MKTFKYEKPWRYFDKWLLFEWHFYWYYLVLFKGWKLTYDAFGDMYLEHKVKDYRLEE